MNLKGLTLIELLIAVGIMTILALVTVPNLINYRRAQDLDFDAKGIVSALRDAQQRAITQENISAAPEQWGVHFEDSASGQDFYEVFRGTTYLAGTAISKKPLKSSIEFDAPVPPNVFLKNLTGLPVSASFVTIKIKGTTICSSSDCKTINITTNGTFTY